MRAAQAFVSLSTASNQKIAFPASDGRERDKRNMVRS